ncbi:DNA protecting protein DprA [Candidatus Woesebacteria bacterium RIFCSPLOWO2_01_FULL_39_23]|uniref:DNA protecting protein DprA n=1 Tax=Candidatus Woesebacteria bacterium RIFCSPHIGHO2_01_FULL_40_22 TaxID=1802499 RepID=A0A1F7YJY0_9BACT|nr:MAG: DNA protecting protein DprA [Candidatus Woesebacteria bacterium RBG_16_40_11]OGM26908.1 MAG: DNA protecting protein DprA [Candidatus Woesebacteria bacterium RIFCSPHIGHO2_01_FULL_40_22]OGM38463.1 MAG: DNA protecting protein DprA [Candidatus Woesebacteria bacterium RIFCSPHIGHO2_12_FULL_38_9]OGM63183.1 MAG: DNA protecting protein DprA [Candidatus Woesebacteria bacterium RIFCSPLOWO2_01_FULL_39_23]
MNEREYLIALASFMSFGPARIKLMLSYFGSAKKTWDVQKEDLLEIGLKEQSVNDFIKYREGIELPKYFNDLKRHSIGCITINDHEYPQNLRGLGDAPLVLYLRGRLISSDINSVAIVGSRKMTSYGREVTERLSRELASLGITVVSGLAFGIDITAHRSALEADGRCVAVLASGIDIITPRSNEWLGLEIIKKGGAIISEYPPGVIPQKYFFPYRNRIISGLSKAVIVVEGMIKSGTIHTAKHAADQGRQVFAVPGQITSPMSGAPHYLIKNGARMLTDVKDILDELDMQLKVDKDIVERVMPSDIYEEKLIEVLANEPLYIDEIGRISGLTVSTISSKLTVMELKGMVKNIGGGIYRKC